MKKAILKIHQFLLTNYYNCKDWFGNKVHLFPPPQIVGSSCCLKQNTTEVFTPQKSATATNNSITYFVACLDPRHYGENSNDSS